MIFWPVLEVKFIYTCRSFFILNKWGCFWYFKGCEAWEIAKYNLLREELSVLNDRAIFVGFYFLLEFKKGLTAHSWTTTTIPNHSYIYRPSQPRASLLVQLKIGGRRKISTRQRLGWGLLTVKVGEIYENIREVKSEGWGRIWLSGCKSACCCYS